MPLQTKIVQIKLDYQIFDIYYSWSIHSKSKNFLKMEGIVLPNSDFHGLSYACQKSHDTGINYNYEFEELEIVKVSKNQKEATIQGYVVLNMVCIDNNYKGKFISTCCRDRLSENWKLNDIEIEWE